MFRFIIFRSNCYTYNAKIVRTARFISMHLLFRNNISIFSLLFNSLSFSIFWILYWSDSWRLIKFYIFDNFHCLCWLPDFLIFRYFDFSELFYFFDFDYPAVVFRSWTLTIIGNRIDVDLMSLMIHKPANEANWTPVNIWTRLSLTFRK